MHTVRLQGARCAILLPVRGHILDYLTALQGRFGEQAALATIACEDAELRADSPVVAIVVSDPKKLTPGADQDTEDLITLVANMRCQPVLIPPCADMMLEEQQRHNAVVAMTRILDGVLGPGGDDVDPRIYGEARTVEVGATHYQRDLFEARFALAARAQMLFMFGICRSHQLWNAAFGGSLVQDVRVEGKSITTQDQEALGIPMDQPLIVRWPDGTVRFENRVWIDQTSWFGATLRMESVLTNSYHHQAVDVPGTGMRVVGVVRDQEAGKDTIEVTEDWNVMSTQFHPELMQQAPEEKRLLGMLGRRAWVFWCLRGMQAPITLEALMHRLRALPEGTLAADDFDWVRHALAPRL